MTDNSPYAVRECSGHYHVTVCGEDLVGAKFDTREEADEYQRMLSVFHTGTEAERITGKVRDVEGKKGLEWDYPNEAEDD